MENSLKSELDRMALFNLEDMAEKMIKEKV